MKGLRILLSIERSERFGEALLADILYDSS